MKWGVIWEDGKNGIRHNNNTFVFLKNVDFIGTIPPTPACKRALNQVISALKKQGHEVVDLYVLTPPFFYFFLLYSHHHHLI